MDGLGGECGQPGRVKDEPARHLVCILVPGTRKALRHDPRSGNCHPDFVRLALGGDGLGLEGPGHPARVFGGSVDGGIDPPGLGGALAGSRADGILDPGHEHHR